MKLLRYATFVLLALVVNSSFGVTFKTRYATFMIDGRGYLTSIVAGSEYLAKGKPSPILSLRAGTKEILPVRASYAGHRLTIEYPNKAKAIVEIVQKPDYIRLQLRELHNRGDVDNIVWGPIHTTISETIGDLIGVVRDGREAIGMLALNDNTTEGPPRDSDLGQMYYYIHSPDPKRYPVPPQYHEGQRFSIGGDGRSDVAFYSHPEEYFHMGFQSGAVLEPGSGSVLTYHSRDRRKPQTIFFTLIPGLPPTQPRHQVVDPVDADFIGSKVALYACPDPQGLQTIHEIVKQEGLLDLKVDGKWAKNPAAYRPDIAWSGPHDKLIEYADALGLKAVQDEGMGEYYIDPGNRWDGPRVGFEDGRKETIRQFTDQLKQHGILYGLHTLCMFVQTGSSDVHPIPNLHFQTVLRTHLASAIDDQKADIVVTDPSFLAEKGTWHDNDMNVLRIGTELLTYDGISSSAPWTLKNVKRGQYGTRASAHAQGDELVKLQITCYQGFIPDMKLTLQYADLYAKRMADLGTQYIDFDGLESCMYQNHGDFAFKTFFHRLFDSYHRLTGAYPRVMGSCVTEGNWHYMSVCNVGGDKNMFDPVANKWGIEGKDVRYQFHSSYFPATFGIQSFRSDWTEYDAENLEAKSIGWDAMYMLGLSQDAVEKNGKKDHIFEAFRTWEDARAAGVFTPQIKAKLRDMNLKFDLKRSGKGFLLRSVKELHGLTIDNPYGRQPLCFSLRFTKPQTQVSVTLPNGEVISYRDRIVPGDYLMFAGTFLDLMTANGMPTGPAGPSFKAKYLPHGKSTFKVSTPDVELTTWVLGSAQLLSSEGHIVK